MLAFTGGVGDHSALVRRWAAERSGFPGIAIDPRRNAQRTAMASLIAVGAAVRTVMVDRVGGPVDRLRGVDAARRGVAGTGESKPRRSRVCGARVPPSARRSSSRTCGTSICWDRNDADSPRVVAVSSTRCIA